MQVIREGTGKTAEKHNRWRGEGCFVRGGAQGGGGKVEQGLNGVGGCRSVCREGASQHMVWNLTVCVGCWRSKAKDALDFKEGVHFWGCLGLWHYWVREMLP